LMPVESVQKAIDLLERGRAEQAIPLLEDVVAALPAYAGAYVLLARAFEAGERWMNAAHAWRSALILVPDSPVAAEGLRRALREGHNLSPEAVADQETYSEVEALHRSIPAPRAQPGPAGEDPASEEYLDNLDRLIAQLENARITPDPDLDAVAPPDFEDDIEDMVSETLARIYATQKQFDDAARVYDQLASQHPEREAHFRQKAIEMRAKRGGTGST
ncbi:MAG: tetratricopeptide repeat protein, partial [Bacteroidota bacterium]